MDIFEAVDSRIACRHFLDKPVDLGIVRELIIARATRGIRRQSAILERLCTDRTSRSTSSSGSSPNASPAKTRATSSRNIRSIPSRCSAPTRSAARSMACSSTARSASTQTTGRGGSSNSRRTSSSSARRSALFITIDRRLGPGQWADLGGYIHALAFLARGYGLDTCPQEAWARLYDTVGGFLKCRRHEILFCGVAIGYGDRKHKANDFRSPRAELSRVLQVPRIRLDDRSVRRNAGLM